MSLFDETDLEYPLTVTVQRPLETFDEAGNYEESFITVVEEMAADIQLSLRVRTFVSEDRTGVSDNAVWIMYCNPPEPLAQGDRVSDGSRTFVIDEVGEWGSHAECVMRSA